MVLHINLCSSLLEEWIRWARRRKQLSGFCRRIGTARTQMVLNRRHHFSVHSEFGVKCLLPADHISTFLLILFHLTRFHLAFLFHSQPITTNFVRMPQTKTVVSQRCNFFFFHGNCLNVETWSARAVLSILPNIKICCLVLRQVS